MPGDSQGHHSDEPGVSQRRWRQTSSPTSFGSRRRPRSVVRSSRASGASLALAERGAAARYSATPIRASVFRPNGATGGCGHLPSVWSHGAARHSVRGLPRGILFGCLGYPDSVLVWLPCGTAGVRIAHRRPAVTWAFRGSRRPQAHGHILGGPPTGPTPHSRKCPEDRTVRRWRHSADQTLTVHDLRQYCAASRWPSCAADRSPRSSRSAVTPRWR